MSFRIDGRSLLDGLTRFELMTKQAVGLYADVAGKKLEAEAKKGAPWADRTGHSRQTIQGGKEWEGNRCNIYLSGNTAHFPYLELAMEKRYAILKPTISKKASEIISGMRNIIR